MSGSLAKYNELDALSKQLIEKNRPNTDIEPVVSSHVQSG